MSVLILNTVNKISIMKIKETNGDKSPDHMCFFFFLEKQQEGTFNGTLEIFGILSVVVTWVSAVLRTHLSEHLTVYYMPFIINMYTSNF